MNESNRTEFNQTPPLLPNAATSFKRLPAIDWRHWARRLLVCNPFFLCSAALLLFGVNRLSLDPNFLGDDKSNLLFNYTALQLYALLVGTTAIILAHRKIWYDSALLVVLENGLVLVPFMLISQGALIHRGLGATLALAAVLLAALRTLAIRRGYPQFNLPRRALALGSVILLTNAALPLIYPPAVVKDTDDWAAPNQLLWHLVLPLLVAGANFLPKPKRYGGLNPERHWLPLFIYALWVVGTGTHIWALGHISNLSFEIHHLAPAVLVAVWTMYRRLGDCLPEPGVNWQRAMLGLAFATPLLSYANGDLFEALIFVNGLGFAALFVRGNAAVRTFAREMLVLSLPLATVGLPMEIGRLVIPHFVREQGFFLALGLIVTVSALRWFRLPLGVAGAFTVTIMAAQLWPAASWHAYIEVASLFLLTHSLAWPKHELGANFFRFAAGSVWFGDACVWIYGAPTPTDLRVAGAAMILLAAWLAIWRLGKERPALLPPVFALAVMAIAPTDWMMRYGSAGVIALAASVCLFAAGFVVAWTRHRWERKA